jgi:hypothetical protein
VLLALPGAGDGDGEGEYSIHFHTAKQLGLRSS